MKFCALPGTSLGLSNYLVFSLLGLTLALAGVAFGLLEGRSHGSYSEDEFDDYPA